MRLENQDLRKGLRHVYRSSHVDKRALRILKVCLVLHKKMPLSIFQGIIPQQPHKVQNPIWACVEEVYRYDFSIMEFILM